MKSNGYKPHRQKFYVRYALRRQRQGVWEIWDDKLGFTGYVVIRNNPRVRWELKTNTGNKVLLVGKSIDDVISQYPEFCGKKNTVGLVGGEL